MRKPRMCGYHERKGLATTITRKRSRSCAYGAGCRNSDTPDRHKACIPKGRWR